MIACQLENTNNTKCKKKISKENDDNKCPSCIFYFCKQHLVRHKCPRNISIQDKQQKQTEVNSNQNDLKQEKNDDAKQQNYQEQQTKKLESYDDMLKFQLKQHQKQNKIIHYVPEIDSDNIISKEFQKTQVQDQDEKQQKYQDRYKQSLQRQLESKYVIKENNGRRKYNNKYHNKEHKKDQKEEFPSIEVQQQKEEQKQEQQQKLRQSQIQKQDQQQEVEDGEQHSIQIKQQFIQQVEKGIEGEEDLDLENMSEEEKIKQKKKIAKIKMINAMKELSNIYKNYKKENGEQKSQLPQQQKAYIQGFSTFYEAYQQQNKENQKQIEDYIDLRKTEMIQSDKAEYFDQKKKDLFHSIDINIPLKNENKEKNFTTITFPEKQNSEYYFSSVKEEQKYKKILPISSKFLGKPYDLQMNLIYKILNGLDTPKDQNILVEAPSGTGKTMAILSACLSFLKKHRETNTTGYRYQIIYVSNTYNQLQHVADEIKKTNYDLRCRVMASQEEMCINGRVFKEFLKNRKKYKNQSNFNLNCQVACVQKKCNAQINSSKYFDQIAQSREMVDIEQIDNLTENFDNRTSTCPYFDLNNTVDLQDVILAPYDLILDQRGIKRLGKIPRRLLIVFDEAHNVIEEACNGSSYRLDLITLHKVINYCQQLSMDISTQIQQIDQQYSQSVIDYYKKQQQLQIEQLEYNLQMGQVLGLNKQQQEQIQISIDQIKQNSLENYVNFQKSKMSKILQDINTIQINLDQTVKNFESELKKNHYKKSEIYKLADTYKRIISKLFSREEDEIKLLNLLKALKHVIDYSYESRFKTKNEKFALMAPMEDLQFFFHELLMTVREDPMNYKLMAQFQEQGYLNKQEKNITYILQCFEPQKALKRLLKFPQSHFILFSSTLTPFQSFLKEFSKLNQQKRMPFQTHLFKQHVIQKNQFFGRILNIPSQFRSSDKPWECKFCKSTNQPESMICIKCEKQKPSWLKIIRKNIEPSEAERKKDQKRQVSKQGQQIFDEIGMYLEKLIEKIPEGVILVFPNLNLMEKCKYAWFEGSKYGQLIEKHKKVFFQPRKKHEYRSVIQQYKEEIINNKNAMLFAVSYTDFLDSFEIRDSLSRAIFIIGKPGMDRSDGYVQEKMKYLEQNHGKEWLWYNDYSIREINKTIGKVIRNQDDYGGVYLIDDIYVSASWVSDKISLWAKDNFKVENNLENLVKDTEQFFCQPFKPCQPIQIKKPPVKQQEDNYDYDFQEDVEIDQNLLSDNQKGEQLVQNSVQGNKKENLDLKNEDFDIFSQPVEEKQKQNQNGYEQESEEEDDFI